eukprot:TRINITY_DN236_c0_g1_i1.p1 TRINITY_DN236_c0_g1~~TRINITY_DN236_c0_g1_i1.p1  ORF type:complete len:273 (-),score=113.16 TRINITY_DN236_c0_g1_i1:57-875(-)
MKFSGTFFFFLVLSILIAITAAQDCGPLDTCFDCVVETGCGWCESTGDCTAGDKVGPGGASGNCSEWFFETCTTLPCETHDGCLACSRDPFCGWCPTTGSCVEGDVTAPLFGSCPTYTFSDSDCPSSAPPPPPPSRRPPPPPPKRSPPPPPPSRKTRSARRNGPPPPPPSRRPPPPPPKRSPPPPPPSRKTRSARRNGPPPPPPSKKTRSRSPRRHRSPPPPPPKKSHSRSRTPSRTPSNSLFRSISAGSSVSPATVFVALATAVVALANFI